MPGILAARRWEISMAMKTEHPENTPIGRLIEGTFIYTEYLIYLALGGLLAASALLALAVSAQSVWSAIVNWEGTEGIIEAVDRLLFVFMIAEIIHTVRMSVRSGVLTVEPFLVVGVIASIRRVLVITLESANSSKTGAGPQHVPFENAMIELGVLGALILIMVLAIFMLHRSGQVASTEPKEETSH